MNLVSIAMQFLAPTIVSKLASSFGITSPIAQKLIAAAIPTILAGIVGRGAQPGGASMLTDLLGKQDPGLLGGFADLIGGSQQKTVAEQGMGALGSLLGGSALSSLTGALGKFTGAGDTATSGLVGLLAPAILGTISQQQKSAGLDTGGLMSMLAGQKDNIAAAIPGDFAKLLGGSGLLDSIAPNLAKLNAAPAPAPVSDYGRPAESSGFNWWPWAAAAALAAFGYWYVFTGRTPPQAAIPVPPQIMVGNANVADQFGGVMNTLRTSLGGVKDAASAQAALPRLREAQTEIERIGALTGQLSGDAKKSFASYVATWLPMLTPMMTSLLGNSAVAPVLKPALDGLTSRLTAMSKP